MVPRHIENTCRETAGFYPVLTILGPRQSGKTTLVKMVWPEKPYFNLERPDIRSRIEADPLAFFAAQPEGAVLDEIQQLPGLLSWIQADCDERPGNGRFILTGSSQPELLHHVSQSLAGRTGILKLLPFTAEELARLAPLPALDRLLQGGFFPRIHDQRIPPAQALGDYCQTYVERDVRRLVNIRNLDLFRRFLGLCAGRVGNILDLVSLGNDCGVSHTTAREWLSVLEAGFIVYRLRPWFDNIGKRLIKSPKLYFYDVGLVAFLCGITEPVHLVNHPLRGALFENLVVMEFLKGRFNRGLVDNLHYYRDANGLEIDLVLAEGNHVQPIEIKSATTVLPELAGALGRFGKLYPDRLSAPLLVHAGSETCRLRDVLFLPWERCVGMG
jgi:hypothetical protein